MLFDLHAAILLHNHCITICDYYTIPILEYYTAVFRFSSCMIVWKTTIYLLPLYHDTGSCETNARRSEASSFASSPVPAQFNVWQCFGTIGRLFRTLRTLMKISTLHMVQRGHLAKTLESFIAAGVCFARPCYRSVFRMLINLDHGRFHVC